MIHSTHSLFGVTLAEVILVSEHAPLSWQAGAVLIAAGLAAPFPDMDHPSSWVTLHVPGLRLVSKVVQHRTLTHSILLSAVLYLLLFDVIPVVPPWLATGIVVGWISHWIIDLINPMGVRVFYPLKVWIKPPIHMLSIAVNGIGETVIRTMLKAFAVIVIFLYLAVLIPHIPFMVTHPAHELLRYITWPWLGNGAKWLGFKA